ncbi:hypothetical protein [uncultured Gammaproteobacteria bacterium]|uniref:Uncharacterized protein n=1 Tax=Bathymodiolus azoricus thioautotrophic gill symbiont TaxID=235205 RepID=A0ACA8ZTW2_9GAMM|nr:hypothetical protein AZO1586R_974 [Bathymodiolus azoricus thioautotrophic gill symbiont]CAC9503223.1 hypothetical protein [uncultured Gammaproteobacteria bacterium]CAC9509064.1 hypothetical protein [uncultured Gammaproteobacteria bacterium]CAC9517818.1 hypothetical protein [uncultured Gammaproteobacteria bacterium]CAC9535237.1 hypothetical protein [uncultured Gammaproteobacteria bacterium]
MIWMVGKMGGFGLFGVGFKGRLSRHLLIQGVINSYRLV